MRVLRQCKVRWAEVMFVTIQRENIRPLQRNEQGCYSGRKITASLGNVTVRGGKWWKGQGGSAMAKRLSMYSINENIYYWQLSSVAILLQPEPVFTSYSTRKGLRSLFLCAIALLSSPPSHVSTCNGQRSSQLFCVHYTMLKLPDMFS
jgi:hypothetical protein